MRRMIATARPHLLAVSVAAAAVAVAGCSAGQITQTDSQTAAVTAEKATVGDLRINDAALQNPLDKKFWAQGSTVPLEMSIANDGAKPDAVQSVSTPAAQKVAVKGQKNIAAQDALTVDGQGKKVGTADFELTGLKQNIYPGQVIKVTVTFAKAGPVDLRVPIGAPEYADQNKS